MIDSELVAYFQQQLMHWYDKNGREYLWRNEELTNYQYVIAEVLLQRTKADTVAKFYPAFIKRFRDWNDIVEASQLEIQEILKPVGLFVQRSNRLKLLANEMVKRNGILPSDRHDLESIPFMGQYIANSVELIIFNKPSPLMDVNMARVLERFFGERKLADIRYDPYLQSLSYAIVAHSEPKKINWAILDFAALICQAKKPKCYDCPINLKCSFYLKNISLILSSKLGL